MVIMFIDKQNISPKSLYRFVGQYGRLIMCGCERDNDGRTAS